MLDIEELKPLPPFSEKTLQLKACQRYLRYYQYNFLEQKKCIRQAFGGKHFGQFHIALHHLEVDNPKGHILVLHGYLDHSGMQRKLIEFLLSQSFNVMTFDLPGHGLSSGERAGIDSFDDYQEVLEGLVGFMKTQSIAPRYMIGHSTGGAIAMTFIQRNQFHGFSKLILIAPLIEPRQWSLIKWQVPLLKPFLSRIRRKFNRNTNDSAVWHFMAFQDPLQARFIQSSWLNALSEWIKRFERAGVVDIPTLVIQGDNDMTVSWKKNCQLIEKKFSQLSYKEIAGGRHQLINEKTSYLNQLFTAIKRFID